MQLKIAEYENAIKGQVENFYFYCLGVHECDWVSEKNI